MTNRERLISLLGFAPPPNSAEGALLDAGIAEADTYTASNINSIKRCAIEVMNIIITTADTGNDGPGFQTKYDRPSILARIKQIQAELDPATSGPTITGKQVW